MNNAFLRTIPFSDTVLRQMAIRFTDTEEQMLRIPDANPEKVRLYGKHFTKLVRDCHRQYNEMSGGNDDPRVLDPNLQNVIDLVSDDEDEGDDYGPDFEGSDMEEDEGESSGYFQPDARVQAFNQKFADSQLASNAAASSQAPAGRKSAAKPRKQKWKARGSTGASRGAGSRASGRGGASSGKRAPKRSTGGGAASKRGGGGASGGFSMMPT
jgi:bloom syndrome protein